MSSVNEEKGQSQFSSGDGSALGATTIGLPPDPDAHLSDEEKAAIVGFPLHISVVSGFAMSYLPVLFCSSRTANSSLGLISF